MLVELNHLDLTADLNELQMVRVESWTLLRLLNLRVFTFPACGTPSGWWRLLDCILLFQRGAQP